jgi:nickel-dependent lactate racemase
MNHRLAVDASEPSGIHRGCREGNLRGNPVAADLAEVAAQAPAAFLVNVIVGRDGEPVDLVTGSAAAAHQAGIRRARRAIEVAIEPVPLAVVAAADPGRERDWIQSHKTVRQGAAAVADGGVLIAIAACPDGIGSSTLVDWFDVAPAHLAAEVAAHYTLHGHTALAMRALTRRITILLVSRLDPEIVHRMGMTPAADLSQALALAARIVPPGSRALALPRAGSLLLRPRVV